MKAEQKVIKILGKKTGLGNQIQFIPIIQLLQKEYTVCSDSAVFAALGLSMAKEQKADIYITVFGYNYKNFWKERLFKSGKFFGFKYRIKKRHIGFGYKKSLRFHDEKHEIWNNIQLYNHCFNKNILDVEYNLPKENSIQKENNLVIAGISPKEDKTLSNDLWLEVIREIENMGYKVKTVDKDIGHNHVETPSLEILKEEIRKAAFYIGTDSGVAHLADILQIPSLIMFGSTSIEKNKPYNTGSIVLNRNLSCSPCFDWGRVNCAINYQCMKFSAQEIITAFHNLTKDKK